MGRTNSIITVAALATVLFVWSPILAQEDGEESAIPQELVEARKLLEGIPNLEGKSEEEIKAFLASHPEYVRRIEAAQEKIKAMTSRLGAEIDMEKIEALAKELESIEEIQGKSEEELSKILTEKPEVRRRVSSVGRRIAIASGASPSAVHDEDEDSGPASTESSLVPDEIGEVVVLPDGTTTNVIDDVSFGELNWDFGGFNGSRAEYGNVLISGLKMAHDGLSFQYVQDLSVWGLPHGDADALACLFVCDNDGKWVGGKFDWISSSRKTRDFKNIYSGYEGWSLRNVSNPCTAAFVIVSKDGRKRSNVITAMWER